MAIDLPRRVSDFIEKQVDSVETLHVLMLLLDQPDGRWTIRTISDELRSSETSVQSRLKSLIQKEVLSPEAASDGEIRYLPFDPEVDRAVREALDFYRRAPYRVVDLIFSKRTGAIRSIADAFRFRREDS